MSFTTVKPWTFQVKASSRSTEPSGPIVIYVEISWFSNRMWTSHDEGRTRGIVVWILFYVDHIWELHSARHPQTTVQFSGMDFGGECMRGYPPPFPRDELRLSKISSILPKKKGTRRGWSHFLVVHPFSRKILDAPLSFFAKLAQ